MKLGGSKCHRIAIVYPGSLIVTAFHACWNLNLDLELGLGLGIVGTGGTGTGTGTCEADFSHYDKGKFPNFNSAIENYPPGQE